MEDAADDWIVRLATTGNWLAYSCFNGAHVGHTVSLRPGLVPAGNHVHENQGRRVFKRTTQPPKHSGRQANDAQYKLWQTYRNSAALEGKGDGERGL